MMILSVSLQPIHRCRCAAFTLAELLFVIIIIAILTTVAFSIWPGKSVNLATQSEQLISEIRYIRNYAITHDERYRVNFNSGRRQVSLSDRSGRCINDPATGACQLTLSAGTRMATLGLPNGYIAFDRDGTPYNGANQRLRRPATVILAAKGESRTISIIPETGAVILS